MQDLAPSSSELDALEARVAAVEARVYGCGGEGGVAQQQSAAEALAAAIAVLRTATAGRDKVAVVVHQRFAELEGYLSRATASGGAASEGGGGSSSGGGTAAAAALWPLVAREEPTARAASAQLQRLAELSPLVDQKPLDAVAALRPRLTVTGAAAADAWVQAQRLDQEVSKLKEQQKAALDNMAQGLALFEAQVSRLETAAKPRKVID